METYTSDSSDTDSRELKTLDLSRLHLNGVNFDDDNQVVSLTSRSKIVHTAMQQQQQLQLEQHKQQYAQQQCKAHKDIETLLLNHNEIVLLPPSITLFTNLQILDLSSNWLTQLPDCIGQLPLITLIVKNNRLTNKSLPKSFQMRNSTLKELNLSGNRLTHLPEQVVELRHLKYLYLGGNQIQSIPKDIWKMHSLQVLSLGGNRISDVPDAVSLLSQLQALVLCDNQIENLPASIARLGNLQSLLIHKNRLKHLPKDIVALKNLIALSLRDNPLVVRFVQDMALNPPSLMELAARVVKSAGVEYGVDDLPRTINEYLMSANCCVNPKCRGVFFDNRVEHIKFVDFCGKYRVPLLQYLCSSKCIEPEQQQRDAQTGNGGAGGARPAPGGGGAAGHNHNHNHNHNNNNNNNANGGASGYMMRKVLLG